MDQDRLFELLVELHAGLDRQGPGDTASTLRALDRCEHLPDAPAILDIGCGAGAQTLVLADSTGGTITAVDLFPVFLEQLDARIRERGLETRITARTADMADLPFAPESFDLLWSEGAIYIMGFDVGLTKWRPLVRPGGYLVVSELSWFKPDPPAEIRDYWAEEHPAMRGVESSLAAARELGWQPVANFHLPTAAWTDDYYAPLRARIPVFRAAHSGDAMAEEIAASTEREMAMIETFGDWYGYEFFVLRRAGGAGGA